MDRQMYKDKLRNILSDFTKFRKLTESVTSVAWRIEDKVNRFLRKIRDLGLIDIHQYMSIYASGSSPIILYGLPKVHKLGLPL